MRPSGWRRIGIVVSVVWFVGAGFYVWSESTHSTIGFFTSSLQMCNAGLSAETEALSAIQDTKERDKKFEANLKENRECKKRAEASLDRQLDEQWSSIPLLLAIDAGTVVFGWLVVWGLVAVVRWVRRGFAAA